MKRKERGILPLKRNQAESRASERRSNMGLYKRGQVWWMRFSYRGKQIRRPTETGEKKLAERIMKGSNGSRVDVNRVVKKAIEGGNGTRYTAVHGKLDQVKGLRK